MDFPKDCAFVGCDHVKQTLVSEARQIGTDETLVWHDANAACPG